MENDKYRVFLRNIFEQVGLFFLFDGDVHVLADGMLQEVVEVGHHHLLFDFAERLPVLPYDPWLSLVVEKLGAMEVSSRQKLYREEKIYHVLQKLLESTVISGQPSRYEPIIEDEFSYEVSEIIAGVWKLLARLTADKDTLVVVLKNVQYAMASTLLFLEFVSQQKHERLRIFGFFNGSDRPLKKEMAHLVSLCEENKCFFDIATESMDIQISQSWWLTKTLEFSSGDILKLQKNFLAYNAAKDARLLGDSWLKNLAFSSLSERDQLRFFWQTGKALMLLQDYNDAAVQLNSAFTLMQRNRPSSADVVLLHRDIAYISFMKNSIQEALEIVEKGFQLKDAQKEKQAYFNLFFLYFQIEDKHRRQQPIPWKDIYDKVIGLAEELRYENHLAAIYTNPYGIHSEYASDLDKYNTLIFNDTGISIAKKLRNTYRLSQGYQFRGLIYSIMGQYDKVIDWYRRALVLKKRMNLPLEIAYGYNGVGFYYYMTGRYAQAYEYYMQALDYLYSLKDFYEIAMTYFNMGAACLLALDYERAMLFFQEILKLGDILNMSGLAYHSLFGVYAILGTTYALLSDWSQMYHCINAIRLKKLLPHLEKNEEYFFVAMLLGLAAYHEERKGEMVQRFREANYYLHRTNENISYLIPWYCFVTATIYGSMEMNDMASQMWREGSRQSEMQNYPYYKTIFSHRRENAYLPAFQPNDVPVFRHILELAQAEYKIAEIYRQMQDIHVLNLLQQDFIEQRETSQLIEAVMNKLKQNFLIDFVYFFEWQGNEWRLVLHVGKEIHFILSVMEIDSFGEREKEHLWRCDEKGTLDGKIFLEISSLVYVPIVWSEQRAFLLCGTVRGNTMLNGEDLRVLHLIGQQMQISFERIASIKKIEAQKQELENAYKKLEEMATHDALTGTMNRMALQHRLTEEAERAKRYGDNPKNCFSLLFLDMDNFKEINDRFGYDIGDMVLSETAFFLNEMLRTVDLIFRYGGDEFVILLPETSGQQAQVLASRIQSDVPSRVRAKLGVSLLPTFSIGIVDYDGKISLSVEELLQRVDQVLGEAKKKGKNCFVFRAWE